MSYDQYMLTDLASHLFPLSIPLIPFTDPALHQEDLQHFLLGGMKQRGASGEVGGQSSTRLKT